MDSNEQDFLLRNLEILSLHERCAQSLIHEYGHILNYRLFDISHVSSYDDQLEWFLKSEYWGNVYMRANGFQGMDQQKILHTLKECFAEDYRISLNFKFDNGMFIIPNAETFTSDFCKPQLLREGVEIVEELIKNVQKTNRKGHYNSENEANPVVTLNNTLRRFGRYGNPTHYSDELRQQLLGEIEARRTTLIQVLSK